MPLELAEMTDRTVNLRDEPDFVRFLVAWRGAVFATIPTIVEE